MMMEVVVTTGTTSRAKLQSNHYHQQTNTQFFTGHFNGHRQTDVRQTDVRQHHRLIPPPRRWGITKMHN